MRSRTRFQPVTPRDLDAALAGRIGAYSVLYIDGRYENLPSPYGDGRTFYYTRADWSEGVSWIRFTVRGRVFTRRARNVQIGNGSCTWVRIGGKNYQLNDNPGCSPAGN